MFEGTSNDWHQEDTFLQHSSKAQSLLLRSGNKCVQQTPESKILQVTKSRGKRTIKSTLLEIISANAYIIFLLPHTVSKVNKYKFIIFCPVSSYHSQIFLPVIQHAISIKLEMPIENQNK